MMVSANHALDRRLVQGIAWTGAIRWATQIVSWAATFVIARLLTPTDYGLVGMAMIYVGLVQIVSEGGINTAIVQQRDLTDEQVAELNGLAVMVGVALCAVTLALAEPISWFFDEPQVSHVVMVVSSIFIIRSAQVVPRGLMARDLDFRRLAFVDGLETFVLMAVTVLLALAGWRYWALVAGGIASSLFTSAVSVWWRPHGVRFPRSIAGVRRSVVFAWQVVTSQVAWYTYSNADFAVVGRLLGKAVLGAYSFAWTIASVPVDRVSSMVSRVAPAFFAAVQDDPPALRRYLLNLTDGLAVVTLPACIGLAIVAPEFVAVALGSAWTGAIVPLRLLSVYAAFRSIITPAPQILIATGRSRQSMYFSLLAALILPPAFYLGARWGAAGVAMGWLLVYPIIAVGLFVRYAFRIIGLRAGEYFRALWPALGATLVMAAAILLVRQLLPDGWSPLPMLLTETVAGAAVYCGIIYGFHGDRVRAVHALLRGRQPGPGSLVYESAPAPFQDRLLVISYHFAPGTAVGALRWQKFARFAAERGWGLDVITLDPASLRVKETAALSELPPGVRVFGVPPQRVTVDRVITAIWERWRAARTRPKPATPTVPPGPVPRQLSLARKDLRWWPREPRDLARGYFAVVDHLEHARWARNAARMALEVYDPHSHRAVITCGPPHAVHLGGVRVARKIHLPLVVDMRDPWSLVQRLPEAVASQAGLWLARRGERRAVAAAALVVANTQAFRSAMRQKYRTASNRIIAVPNGADDDPMPAAVPTRRFTVAYAGTVYLDRDPRPLFQAAARLIRELELTPADFGIEFMGEVHSFDGMPLERLAGDAGIGNYVTLLPGGPRAAAMAFLARATMLVVLPQDSDMAIPAKVFDYIRFDAWVLALAERGSATDSLLRDTGADLVRPADVDGLTEILRKRYLQHLRGEKGTRIAALARLNRRHQAGVLFDALEQIVGAPTRPAAENAAPLRQLPQATA